MGKENFFWVKDDKSERLCRKIDGTHLGYVVKEIKIRKPEQPKAEEERHRAEEKSYEIRVRLDKEQYEEQYRRAHHGEDPDYTTHAY